MTLHREQFHHEFNFVQNLTERGELIAFQAFIQYLASRQRVVHPMMEIVVLDMHVVEFDDFPPTRYVGDKAEVGPKCSSRADLLLFQALKHAIVDLCLCLNV